MMQINLIWVYGVLIAILLTYLAVAGVLLWHVVHWNEAKVMHADGYSYLCNKIPATFSNNEG